MLLYCTHTTPRLQYIIDLFASQLTTADWVISNNPDEFIAAQGPKINYSPAPVATSSVHIIPHGLLAENAIQPQQITCSQQNGTTIFFQNDSDTGFDIFAAGFYLLSRYEEYLPFQPDQYGRFPHSASLAYREGFLKTPLVNIWLQQFKTLLQQRFQDIEFKKQSFTFLPSYDIDMAYCYKGKGFIRNTGGLLRDLLTLQFGKVAERLKVLSGRICDPFDSFGWLNGLHEKYRLRPYYFFLVADKTSAYDKNISPRSGLMQQLIADHTIRYPVGLHPSWQSNTDINILLQEKNLLSQITGTTITASRQHYLKLSFPQTYRDLVTAGILFDFSMGYSGDNGFRASICTPFKWYDLEKETGTELTIFPSCFMEVTSLFYKKQTTQQAFDEMKQLYGIIQSVNGIFCMIWHNSSFCNEDAYKGWKEMYGEFLASCQSEKDFPHLPD